MAKIIYKKDIKVETTQFAEDVIRLVELLKLKKIDYSLRDQLLRSGTSIGANVI